MKERRRACAKHARRHSLDRFLDRARRKWGIETAEVPTVVVSKATLPTRPKVLVLPEH